MEHHYKCISFRNYSHFRNCQQQEVLCVFPSLFSTSFSFINKIQAIPIPYRTCKIIRCKVYLFNSHLTWHVGRRRVFAQLLSRPSEIIKDRANIFNWRGSTCSYVPMFCDLLKYVLWKILSASRILVKSYLLSFLLKVASLPLLKIDGENPRYLCILCASPDYALEIFAINRTKRVSFVNVEMLPTAVPFLLQAHRERYPWVLYALFRKKTK